MMKSAIVSHVVGYDSHLPTKQVKLPLKYLPKASGKDVPDTYSSNCLGHSEFIDLSSQTGLFFSLVKAGITKDRTALRLTPILVDEATSIGVQVQSLEFLLPHPIIGKGLFTYSFVASSSEDEPYIIIDILDESFLLITFRIELSDFIMGNQSNRLVLDNFSEWVNISVPYSFELRSSPFFMRALDTQNLIISVKDGGLLHFQRAQPLASVDIYNFSDFAPLLSFNFVGNLFSSPENSEVVSAGLSSNAIVDIAVLNADEFVTFSVNQSVKIYNHKSHKQTKANSDLVKTKSDSEWVTNIPNKYFQKHLSSSGEILSLMLPQEKSSEHDTSAYGCASWDVSRGKLEDFSFLELENIFNTSETALNDEAKSLRIQDFDIIDNEGAMEYVVLYKSNTYSEIVTYTQSKTSRGITRSQTSLPQQFSLFAELSSHRESQYYINTIFDSGMFDKNMVASALGVLLQNSDDQLKLDDTLTLRQKVVTAITHISIAKAISEISVWYKLALICSEYRRSSQEALCISVQHDYTLSAELNGLGICREAHPFEVEYLKPNSKNLLELVRSVSSKISPKTSKRLLEDISSQPSIDRTNTEHLASKYLHGKISETESNFLMGQLDSIPDIVKELNELIGTTRLIHLDLESAVQPAAGEGMGLFSLILTVDIFESIRKCHETHLSNLFVLLLLCETNDTILEFMNLIVKRLRTYGLMSQIFNKCFSSSGSHSALEHTSVSLQEYSLFWEICVKKNGILRNMIQIKQYNAAFDFYANVVLGEDCDNTLFDVVIELLNRGESKVVMNEFVPKLDDSTPINSFLIGLVYLLNNDVEKFYAKLSDYTLFKRVNNDKTRQILLQHLRENQSVHEFLVGIFIGSSDDLVTKSNYYHQLSQLAGRFEKSLFTDLPHEQALSGERSHLLGVALDLETSAVQILSNSQDAAGTLQLLGLYLRNQFDIAVRTEDFEVAAESLSILKSMSTKSEFKLLLTKLVKAFVRLQKIGSIFVPGHSDIFFDNYSIVDMILLELANEDLVLSNAMRFYELLYSWRLIGPVRIDTLKSQLVDKRGAAEALYIFITRFQSEKDSLGSDSTQTEDFQQFKLKVLELYKVVLTVLKSTAEVEDRWIRKRSDDKTWKVITLTELNIEYYRWLKDLETDFAIL